MEEIYSQIKKEFEKASKILVVSHRKPDADTLGSAISLRLLLGQWGKDVVLACIDKPSSVFSFLPCVDEYVGEFDLAEFDLVVIVDAGASYMTNFHLKYENFFKTDAVMINIDHHASNDHFGTLNYVDPQAASTTVMIYRLFNAWGVDIDADIATCLVSGIYGDTGGFMHSNTSGEVYEIAAELMERSARIGDIVKALFRTNNVSTLRLWGKVLEQAHVTSDDVVMSVVREDDYEKIGASPGDLSGVIDYLNMVPDSKFAVLINEDRQGNVKGSMRTRSEDVDLSRIAAVFGGGGHPKASGFSIKGKLQEKVQYEIVSDDLSKKSLEF